MPKKINDLEQRIYFLLKNEPFFASISRRITKSVNNNIKTAQVSYNIKSQTFVLEYNPTFFSTIEDTFACGILKHEMYHILLNHLSSRISFEKTSKTKIKFWNIACDLAINSFLRNELPEHCLIPGKGPFKHFALYKSAEFYYDILVKEERSYQDIEINNNHDSWSIGEHSEYDSQIQESKEKEMFNEGIENASKYGWGSLKSDFKEKNILLKKYNNDRIEWKSILNHFVQEAIKAEYKSSIRKINRRYPYIYAGKRTIRSPKIAISVDQSGSMSEDLVETIFEELIKLNKFCEFTYIPFDCIVQEQEIKHFERAELSKNSSPLFRVFSGGTDLNVSSEYVNKRNFSGHIIITDLYGICTTASRCKRLWITMDYCSNISFNNKFKEVILKINKSYSKEEL